jgi:hypothetical protein
MPEGKVEAINQAESYNVKKFGRAIPGSPRPPAVISPVEIPRRSKPLT